MLSIKPIIGIVLDTESIDNTKTGDGADAGCCWLRSPGNDLGSAAHVLADGSIYYIDVNSDDEIVRPALWLNLESEIF